MSIKISPMSKPFTASLKKIDWPFLSTPLFMEKLLILLKRKTKKTIKNLKLNLTNMD